MNKQKWALLFLTLALIAGAGTFLARLGARQKLGQPGVKAQAVPDQVVMRVDLPAHVLDFASTNVAQDATVLATLPKDTSFAQRRYSEPDGFWVNANLILMGTDRTSIHKPEFCLPGQGWTIESKSQVGIPIAGADGGYDLRVAKWVLSDDLPTQGGGRVHVSGLYVFWFVADNEETTDHWQRLWWLARDLMRTGVLQRWAYVSYFTICQPGQEDATFEKVKKLIAASVPAFQLPPKSGGVSRLAKE